LPQFEQNSGNINIGGTASQKVLHKVQFSPSKFAVRGMTQSWQAELRKYNIRVALVNQVKYNCIYLQIARKSRRAQEQSNKLGSEDIAHTIISIVET
jgi:3-oxoacyl-[acyl-carrier protein] reductase